MFINQDPDTSTVRLRTPLQRNTEENKGNVFMPLRLGVYNLGNDLLLVCRFWNMGEYGGFKIFLNQRIVISKLFKQAS